METSGISTYNRTALEIITEALELIGSYQAGETLSPEDTQTALASLNMMAKSWQAEGLGLWKNEDAVLLIEDGEHLYSIGPTGDHCTKVSDLVKTEVATAGAAADTSIVIDSVTGMTDNYDRDGIVKATTPAAGGSLTLDGDLVEGDDIAYLPSQRRVLIYSDGDDSGVSFVISGVSALEGTVLETITGPNTTTVYSTSTFNKIYSITISGVGTGSIEIGCVGDFVGVELDDGTLQWSNIGGVLNTTLPLVDALTDTVAVDNHVYVYTSKLARPIMLTDARLRNLTDTERPLRIKSRQEYMALPNKETQGSVNMLYYDPQKDNGKLYVWMAGNDVKEQLRFTARIPIEDFDSTIDYPDFPQEWLLALSWNLAVNIAPKFGKEVSPNFEFRAERYKAAVSDFDREETSIFLQVGR